MGYAKNIKEYRENGLVTQVELAQKLGIGMASITIWETGIKDD